MTIRDERGYFLPGKSGNPAGSKKLTPAETKARERKRRADAARQRAMKAVEEKFIARFGAVAEATIESAIAGDSGSQRLVMERYHPVQRPDSKPVVLEGYDGPADTASHAVVRAIANGVISPEKGDVLMSILERRANVCVAGLVAVQMSRLQENIKRRGLEQLVPALMEIAA